MDIKLHGSMGDHLMATGIPEAYCKMFGTKVSITANRYNIFFDNNPYVTKEKDGTFYSLRFNSRSDYMIYYPVRIFYDITNNIVHRDLVQPNLYLERHPESKVVLINDQAGWPTRRGYRFMDELAVDLIKANYIVMYLRNEGFKDCNNKDSPRTLKTYHTEVRNPNLNDLITLFRDIDLYIGYESGLSSLAGALKVPYVLIEGSVPAINVAHNSCIYVLRNGTCNCARENCPALCLTKRENGNDEIMEGIRKWKNSQ